MLLDKDQYRRLQMKLKTEEDFNQELKNKKELENELKLCIDSYCVSEDELNQNKIRDEGINGRCKHQLTWRQRSCVVMFCLHPRLGNRDPGLVSQICTIPSRTI